jgi:hypothetical protein
MNEAAMRASIICGLLGASASRQAELKHNRIVA